MGSWVRIPLDIWMFVCVYSVFVLSCVQVSTLQRDDHPSKESYRGNEMSSPSKTLGWWVWIPLNAWVCMCVYFVFVLFCVQVAALRRADPPCKEFYWLWKRLRIWRETTKVQKRAVQPQMNEWMNEWMNTMLDTVHCPKYLWYRVSSYTNARYSSSARYAFLLASGALFTYVFETFVLKRIP
jgi:hypothetical protein